MKILIIANAFFSDKTISGGDFIFANYAKQWERYGNSCKICTNEHGREFCLQEGIKKSNIILFKSCRLDFLGVFIGNIVRTFSSLFSSIKFNFSGYDLIFSASDFLPDVIPAVIAKIKNKKIKWLTGFYFFAPNPFIKKYSGTRLRVITFYLGQKISLFFISRLVDSIFTASGKDRERFIFKRQIKESKVLAIRGGVDTSLISHAHQNCKIYDAVFVGRLHPQKCVDELVLIWNQVCSKQNNLKLIIIGSGPQEHKLKNLVEKLNLNKNIIFFGIKTGIEKFKIIKSAKVFISASHFDSGNMALDESMACGLPGIIYDLPLVHYPQGVVKVPIGDKNAFADEIIKLLNNIELYNKLSREALDFAKNLDWKLMAKRSLDFINSSA